MYCSTCGARVPDGHTRCDNCGAPVSRPMGYGVPAVHTHTHTHVHTPVQGVTGATCPRCGYQGPTVGYFSQGGHIAVLLVLAVMSWAAGGLIYYLLRRDHRSCARCGHVLGKAGDLALASPHGGGISVGAAGEADLPGEGRLWSSIWGIGSILLYFFAAMMMMIAFGEGEPVAAVFAAFAAGAGVLLTKRAQSAREDRHQALLAALQQPVLRLAGERGGRLTVTEVASSLSWPLRRAEKVLDSLEDGLRVASDVTNEGVIVYEFRELMHARRVSATEMDALLIPSAPVQPQRAQAQAQPLSLPHDGTLSA
jgi:hypothetical protein